MRDRERQRFSLLLFRFFLFTFIAVTASAGTPALKGRILDKAHKPIDKAVVRLSSAGISVRTDSCGLFTISPDSINPAAPRADGSSCGTIAIPPAEKRKYSRETLSNAGAETRHARRIMENRSATHSCGNKGIDYLSVEINGIACATMPVSIARDTLLSITLDLLPPVFIDAIDSMPFYFQRDKEFGGFPNGGAVYCGPVSVANSLMWLGKKGYPQIVPFTNDTKENHHSFISLLGSGKYIGTDADGSTAEDVCRGVKRYMKDREIGAKVEFQGWRWVPHEFRTGKDIPDLEWLKDGVVGNKALWLNIGWFDHDAKRNVYKRDGGHWVTLAGYGWDGKEENTDALIIHDPESPEEKACFLLTERIRDGKLTGDYDGLPRDAAGYLRFRIGPHSYGIISGAVKLTIESTPICRDSVSREGRLSLR